MNNDPVIQKLNDELLKKTKDNVMDEPPKRNTKEALVDRIQQIADENNLEITVSNTKLRRMSKPALQKLLGEMLNECMKKQMAEAVKAPGTSDNVIALATLRMMHDMCVFGVEKGLNNYLPKYGYQVEGFSDSMKQPMVSRCVDECLKEIAAESDVLQYIESPYARLGIAWTTALFTCIRRAPPARNIYQRDYNNHPMSYGAPTMEPRQNPQQNPVRPRSDGRAPPGKVNSHGGPTLKTV
jgi:hypothetical protein